jgi:hypothetical protein
MDQNGEQDVEIDHLKTLMDDIKELKSELGVSTDVANIGEGGEEDNDPISEDASLGIDANNNQSREEESSSSKQSIELQADDSMEGHRSSSGKDGDNPVPPMESPFAQDAEAELQVDNLNVEASDIAEEMPVPKKQLCGCCVM